MFSGAPAQPNTTVPKLSYGPSGGLTMGDSRSDSIFDRISNSAQAKGNNIFSRLGGGASYSGSANIGSAVVMGSSSAYDRDMVRTPVRQERSIPGTSGASLGPAAANGAVDNDDETDIDMPPFPDDDAPIVPAELMRSQVKPIQWDRHPCATIILLLLNNRGAFLPQHKDLFEYHMAEQFLEALTLLQYGAFLIKYAAKRSSPKERYFMIRVLPDASEKPTAFLTWQLHQNSCQLIDRVPLADLVGITCNAQSIAFRRYLVTPDLIKGCHTGTRVSKLPTSGCFSLWFYDRKKGVARSLDLLTCSEAVFSLWTATFSAILSVNSSVIGAGGADPRQELRELMMQSQHGVMGQIQREAEDDDEGGEAAAQFMED